MVESKKNKTNKHLDMNNNKAMTEYMPKNKLQLSKTIGGDMSQCPVEFTKDSKYFFSGVGSTIKIYSIQTGSVVKVLSKPSVEGAHEDKVTMLLLNPKNHLQLLSASLDGTIKLWDYNDEVLLKTYIVNEPIAKLVLSPNNPETAYVLTTPKNQLSEKTTTEGSNVINSTRIYQLSLDLISVSTDVNKRLITELDRCTTIAISAGGDYLAMGAQYQLYIWQINELTTRLRTYNVHEGITQLEFHPIKNYLAVGQRTGRITFYYCFTEETAEKPITESHHWHHKEVKSLKFMDDGMYLLSGGCESVLVIWQLDTNNKRFYPRIGGDINFINITPDYQHYCVSIADNSIRFINAFSQSIEQVIQGVQQDFSNNNELMVEPKNNHLVLTKSEGGSIQFYNPKIDSHILDLGIIPHHRNTNSADRSQIKCVSFSCSSGEWMATVDTRNDGINTLEVFLKFWHWDHDQQTYILHTRVDNPHQDEITSLTFHPTAMMAITTSKDKTFKVWHFSNELGRAHIDVEERAWTCRSIGMYRHHYPETSAFSMDGSILAVAFGSVITIWDPYQNIMQGVLPIPETKYIKSLHFINDTSYLISRTKSNIYVWNLLTCSVWWSYHMETNSIAVDPNSDRFIVSAVANNESSYLVLFNAYSPTPLLVHKLDFECNSAVWIPSSSNNSSSTLNSEQRNETKSDIAYLLPDRFLKIMKVLDNSEQGEMEEESSKADIEVTVKPLPQANTPTLFDDAYGKREQQKQKLLKEAAKRNQDATFNRQHGMDGSATINAEQIINKSEDIMGAPSHVLPNVDSLFNSFMSNLMSLKLPSKDEANEMDWNEERPTPTTHNNVNELKQQNSNDNTTMTTDISLNPIKSLDTYFESLMGDNQVLIDNTTDSSISDDQSESDDESDVENIKW